MNFFDQNIIGVGKNDFNNCIHLLTSVTQGRAKFKSRFHEYAAVPFELQRKLIDEYNKTAKEEYA